MQSILLVHKQFWLAMEKKCMVIIPMYPRVDAFEFSSNLDTVDEYFSVMTVKQKLE